MKYLHTFEAFLNEQFITEAVSSAKLMYKKKIKSARSSRPC